MNFENQLKLIRQKKHNEYVDYVNKIEIQGQKDLDKQKKINVLAKLALKYKYIFNPNSIEKAVHTIQKFIRKHYFQPKCINDDEMINIPFLHRVRITFTKNHAPQLRDSKLNEKMKKSTNTKDIITTKRITFAFKYCFDIRDLYPIRNDIIKLENVKYVLLPKDLVRVESLWKKINGYTSESIQYLNLLAYCKSLSHDKNFGYETINEEENINRIKNILDNTDENIVRDNFTITINSIKIDLSVLDNLNKKYFGLI